MKTSRYEALWSETDLDSQQGMSLIEDKINLLYVLTL